MMIRSKMRASKRCMVRGFRVFWKNSRILVGTLASSLGVDRGERWRAAGVLGLNRVYDDDLFIVSYPRSGNTWARFLIANMMDPGSKISFRNIEDYVPDMHRDTSGSRINCMSRPRCIKSHSPRFRSFPRFIYLVRDWRDVIVSFYHYSSQRGWFFGSLQEFLEDQLADTSISAWPNHVNAALDFASENPDRALVIRYEDMLEDTFMSALRISAFVGLDEAVVEGAVERCSFSTLRKSEDHFGSEVQESEDLQFFRKGEAQQWKKRLSDENLKRIIERAGDTFIRLGYDLER